MKKVALYGGAFNPPHKGHIDVAQGVLKSGIVDEVWLSPCNKHNFGKKLLSNHHRVEMCRLATQEFDNIHVSTFEIDNDLPGDTHICLEELNKSYPDGYEFYFIIGMDNAINIKKFKKWELVIDMIPFIIIPRNGYDKPKSSPLLNPPHIFLDNINTKNISSSCIRNWFGNLKLDIYMEIYESIDRKVVTYIINHNLYKDEEESMENISKSKMEVIQTENLIVTEFVEFKATEFINRDGDTGYWTWCHRIGNKQAVVIVAIVKNDGEPDKLVVTKEFRVPLYYMDQNPYEYGFPAGLVDNDEDPITAAKRELEEETGLTVCKVIRSSPFVYNSPGITDESIAMVYVEAEGNISQDKNESSEEIQTMLLDARQVEELMYKPGVKIGAKAWILMDRFVKHGDI